MDQVNRIPLKRLHRINDPHTSVLAAIKASRASPRAVEAVTRLMLDGESRIDEQIHLDCRRDGYIATDDTVQHGRLVLSDAGYLKYTGRDLLTINNSPAREWVATDALQSFANWIPASWTKKLEKAKQKRKISRNARRILGSVEDLVQDFLYYDREEDEELGIESIQDAIKNEEISIRNIVDKFQETLMRQVRGYR